ncbi:MAG: hypothetical protein R2830_08665 [Saprospiraceae bacterium]
MHYLFIDWVKNDEFDLEIFQRFIEKIVIEKFLESVFGYCQKHLPFRLVFQQGKTIKQVLPQGIVEIFDLRKTANVFTSTAIFSPLFSAPITTSSSAARSM